MPDRSLIPACATCGEPVDVPATTVGVRCPACFDRYLREIDLAFLDNLSRFGLRSRQVVAETCLRGLVLAAAEDRKLLAMTVYEQFVGAASDLIGLYVALRERDARPVAETVLAFRLDAAAGRQFFADLAREGPAGMLAAVGLPHPVALPPTPSLGKRERKELIKALGEAVAGLDQLAGYRDLGERALAIAAEHLRGTAVLADRTGWLAGRTLGAGQVASMALDRAHGRLDIATLRVDEERLEQVVGGIDTFTRLARNLIHAYLTLDESDE